MKYNAYTSAEILEDKQIHNLICNGYYNITTAAWSLGCWKENSNNLAIPSGFGLSKLPQTRDESLSAIRQCGNFASQNGYTVFAIFKESICLTGSRAATTYMKYGPSNECRSNGLGGLSSSSVYSLNRSEYK